MTRHHVLRRDMSTFNTLPSVGMGVLSLKASFIFSPLATMLVAQLVVKPPNSIGAIIVVAVGSRVRAQNCKPVHDLRHIGHSSATLLHPLLGSDLLLALYAFVKCGGTGWFGSSCCLEGYKCVALEICYSQVLLYYWHPY